MKESKNNNGFIIAFVGQDGAGKTTICNIIQENLKNKHNDIKSMYLGSGENYSSLLKRIFKKSVKSNSDSCITETLGMLFYLQVARRCAKKAKQSKELAEKGTIVFWDRCPQTQFKGINDGPKIESKYSNSKNFITKLIYPYFQRREIAHLTKAVDICPDIVMKLHLSVAESMRRKPDNDINKIRKKHMIVEKLQFPKSKVIDIDATQPLNEEILQISTYLDEYVSSNKKASNLKRKQFVEQVQQKDEISSEKTQMNIENMFQNDNSINDR